MSDRKRFIIDTSVLLYDKIAIHSFPGNDVILPLQVIDELDRKKESPGLVGECARYVNRFLDDLRSAGQLDAGVEVPSKYSQDQTVRIMIDQDLTKLPRGLEDDRGDNRILAACMSEASRDDSRPIVVVTKDINLRVKCDALGLKAEDYYRDHIQEAELEFHGHTEVYCESQDIDGFFADGFTTAREQLYPHEFAVLRGPAGQSALARHFGGEFYDLKKQPGQLLSFFEAKNKEQRFAAEALLRDDIPLVTLTGLAGSGKTYLALMAGIDGVQQGRYKRIVISRSIQPVGRDLGYLPGDMDDKMQPWLAPITDNFRTMLSDKNYTY